MLFSQTTKRWRVIALSAAMILAVFAGCGNDGGSSTPSDSPASAADGEASADGGGDAGSATSADTTITWLSQGPNEDGWEGKTADMLKQYQQETGVGVTGEFYSFGDLFEVIEVKIASGSSDYDVISVDVPMVAAYATRGYIAPMDAYFTEEDKAGFIPSAVDAGSWDGVFYAPPMNTSSQLLFYNKDLLEEAGVTIRDSDVDSRLTYEEVVDYATRTLDVIDPDRNKGIAGLMFQQVSRTYQMAALPNSLGEPSVGADGYTVDGVLNSPGWIQAMNWYQSLYTDGLALRGITADETSDYFRADKIVFLIGGTWTYGDREEQEKNIGFAPVPAFAGYEDSVATPTGSWHFGINKASNHYDEAAAFIKWFTIGEGNDLWLEANGDVPSTLRAIDIIQAREATTPRMEIQRIATYEAANTAVPRALTPGYSEYSTILDATLEDIRNGSDVEGALNSAVAQITAAMEQYK